MNRIPFVVVSLAFLASCDDGVSPVAEVLECVTSVGAAQGDSFVELCELDAPVRHVRIENLRAPATHASSQIVFGFDDAPASAQSELAADQFRVLFYGGGTPFPPPVLEASFGNVRVELGNAAFVHDASTACFDLHEGGVDKGPAFVLWIDGVKGADCESRATLTAATAYSAVSEWGGAKGAIDKAAKTYFRQSAAGGTSPTIRLFSEPVLDEAAIAAATTCTTTWASNTDWQQLCAPALGKVRHVRIDGARSTVNNNYFYAVFGQDPAPTGNPTPGAGKLIVTGGRSNSGSSWTWFRFGNGTTTQFSYATDTGAALYTDGPSTICFDLGSASGGAGQFIFWATGAKGANCADRATLTPEKALYDSATDAATGDIWSGGWAEGKLNFVKTNSSSASLGVITVSSEAAAL